MKREISGKIFGKSSGIKFHENPSSGSSVVSCGQTDRLSDMHDETVTLRNFAIAPEKCRCGTHIHDVIYVEQ